MPVRGEKPTKLRGGQVAMMREETDKSSAESVVANLIGAEGIEADKCDFLLAFYENEGTLHRAALACQIPLRQARQWLREDPRVAEFCDEIDKILVDELHLVFWRRANDPDSKQPAFPIFALKSRDLRYSERPMTPVAVQVNVTNGGRGGAVVDLAPVLATQQPKALTA